MLISTLISFVLTVFTLAGFGDEALKRLGISRRTAVFIPLSALFLSPRTLCFGWESEVSAACAVPLAAAIALLINKRTDMRKLIGVFAVSTALGAPLLFVLKTGNEALIYAAALIPAAVSVIWGIEEGVCVCSFAPVFASLTGLFVSLAGSGEAEFVLSENETVFAVSSLILIMLTSSSASFFAEKRAVGKARPESVITK